MVIAVPLIAPGEMLPDLIATVILAGMMLVPLVNVVAGLIIGSALGGAAGALGGFCLAVAILAGERWLIGLRIAYASNRDIGHRAAGSEEVAYLQRLDTLDRPIATETVLPIGKPAYVPLECAA